MSWTITLAILVHGGEVPHDAVQTRARRSDHPVVAASPGVRVATRSGQESEVAGFGAPACWPSGLRARSWPKAIQVLGPDHPDTATGLSNLASLLQGQGDFEPLSIGVEIAFR